MLKSARTTAVVIGRVQLPHLAHNHLIQAALNLADQVVVVIGSAWRSRNPKNPFTFSERKEMLTRMLSPEQVARVRFVGVRDVYNDNRWVGMVRDRVEACCTPGEKVTLVGFEKDASSYYLQRFPGWGYVDAGSSMAVDSTMLRDILFLAGPAPKAAFAKLAPYVHAGVLEFLAGWVHTPVYAQRCAEHLANANYRIKYPGPVYQTGDAIVEAADHFLMIERDGALGNGLFGWPGGHQEAGETGLDTSMRELGEETTLPVSREELLASLVDQEVFDAPGRSPRGKIETTACHFKLKGFTAETLPVVYGRDDAKKKPALWLTRQDFAARMHLMFDDHDVIGERFLGEMRPLVEQMATQ